MSDFEVFSWRPEHLTVGELTKVMQSRGWEIRCLHNPNKSQPSDSSVRTSQFLLRDEDVIPVGQSQVYGWKSSHRRSQQLARDFPSTTHSILTWLASYEVPLVQALLYYSPLNRREETWIIARGQQYLEAWRRAQWSFAVSNIHHGLHAKLNAEFSQILSLALLELGHGLHDDDLKGEFIIHTSEGARTFNSLDPDEERKHLEPVPEDTTDYMAEARAFYAEFVEPYYGQPEGASEEEINAFEQKIGFRLPLAYKQFLRWMGKKAKGMSLERSSLGLKLLCRFNLDFDWQLKHRDPTLWGGAGRLTFMMDGEACDEAWIILPRENENPPVYYAYDYDPDDENIGTRKVFDSFSNYLMNGFKWDYEAALIYKKPRL